MDDNYYRIKVEATLYNSGGLSSLLNNLYIELDGTEENLTYEISQNGEMLVKSIDSGYELTQKGKELVMREVKTKSASCYGQFNRSEWG